MEICYHLNDPVSIITLGANDFRFQNACKAANVKTIGDLVSMPYKDLLKLRNLGGKSIIEAYAWLVRNKFENCSTPQPTEKTEERLDWETRTWDLATRIYLATTQYIVPNSEYTREGADAIIAEAKMFIEQYKESFINNSNTL